MQSIEAPVELDFKKTNEDWEGKWLTEDAYDTVIHAKDYEGVNIFSPAGTLDPTPIATVIPNVYDLVSYESIVSHLLDIDETSTMRANAAGPIDHEEMKAKGLIEGEDYKLRTPNSYYLKKKDGTWNDIASGNPIHSIMAGYKRGRFTGKIGLSAWAKSNPDAWEALKVIGDGCARAFQTGQPEAWKRQQIFCEKSIEEEYREGIYTTFSPNKYNNTITKKMSAHIDSGDLGGKTTMAVFRVGDYDGAYFVLPRYRLAIDVDDNSVLITNSGDLHGVTEIIGEGTRLSCVSYCDKKVATKGQLGKSIKPIGIHANKTNLDGFFNE
jgi:hypothetical protein|tara:strand:+ start:736 stop:1710 length:975 start_codon:yes stop_codon:yes gene_type:complete